MTDTDDRGLAPSTEPVTVPDGPHEWHRILDPEELGDQRVVTVAVGRRSLCVTRVGDAFGALDNACPHQGVIDERKRRMRSLRSSQPDRTAHR